jgi:GldM N-terminal domain
MRLQIKTISAFLIVAFFLVQCKSPSQKIVEAFKTVDNSLDNSNYFTNSSIDALYLSIDSSRKTSLTKVAYADSVYSATKNAYKYLDSLKEVLKRKDPTGADLELATSVFIKTKAGDTLLQKLSDVCRHSSSWPIDKSKQSSLDSALVPIRELQIDKNWKKFYFEGTPTVAAITILSKFQHDCINPTIITLRDIKDNVLR